MDSGVGGHQLAVVRWYCVQSDDTIYINFTCNGYLNYIAKFDVLEISSNFRLKDGIWK